MEQKESLNCQIWTRFFLMFLGVWLIVSPMTFGYMGEALFENDIICGLLLLVCGWYARNPKRYWAPWLACAVGLWLQMAPVAFWTHSPTAYLNETITGVLAILLSIIIPGFPGHTERSGPDPSRLVVQPLFLAAAAPCDRSGVLRLACGTLSRRVSTGVHYNDVGPVFQLRKRHEWDDLRDRISFIEVFSCIRCRNGSLSLYA